MRETMRKIRDETYIAKDLTKNNTEEKERNKSFCNVFHFFRVYVI